MSAQLKPQLQLRSMATRDLPQVLTIEQQSYPFPWGEGIFRDCLRSGYFSGVLADNTGTVLGYALMTVAVGEAHVLNLCVAPGARRQGHGRRILDHLMEAARSGHADMMFLEVRPSNTDALVLYRHAGFRDIGTRREYYPSRRGREDALVLARQL